MVDATLQTRLVQGRVHPRVVRLRQVALHGGAAPAAHRQRARPRALPGCRTSSRSTRRCSSATCSPSTTTSSARDSVEAALFGGYLKTVRARHPDEPAPVLHRSDALWENADQLPQAAGGRGVLRAVRRGHGRVGPAQRRAHAGEVRRGPVRGAATTRERQRITAELVKHYFPGFEATGTWLDMSAGLQAMTEHAKGLGYDGVVLFLDELVLWLSGHLRDSTFLSTETSKIAKLVETGIGALPVPLVSFVARQRNLKDFLGGGAAGAEQVALDDSFQWWEGRFERITLPAADLPQIVHRRLLTPSSDAGKAALDRGRGEGARQPGGLPAPAHRRGRVQRRRFRAGLPVLARAGRRDDRAVVDHAARADSAEDHERAARERARRADRRRRHRRRRPVRRRGARRRGSADRGHEAALRRRRAPSTPRRCAPTCSTGTG